MPTNKKPGLGLTLAQVKAELLAAGTLTEAGLRQARQELAADPEWQKFQREQPVRA